MCESVGLLSYVSISCVKHQRLFLLTDNVQRRSFAEEDVIQRHCVTNHVGFHVKTVYRCCSKSIKTQTKGLMLNRIEHLEIQWPSRAVNHWAVVQLGSNKCPIGCGFSKTISSPAFSGNFFDESYCFLGFCMEITEMWDKGKTRIEFIASFSSRIVIGSL